MDGLEGRAGGCEDAVAVARSVNNVELMGFVAGVDDVGDADERAMPPKQVSELPWLLVPRSTDGKLAYDQRNLSPKVLAATLMTF